MAPSPFRAGVIVLVSSAVAFGKERYDSEGPCLRDRMDGPDPSNIPLYKHYPSGANFAKLDNYHRTPRHRIGRDQYTVGLRHSAGDYGVISHSTGSIGFAPNAERKYEQQRSGDGAWIYINKRSSPLRRRELQETDDLTIEDIEPNTDNIITKLDNWLDGFLRLLPNLGVALVVLVIFIAIGTCTGRCIRSRADARERHSLGEVGGSLTKWCIILVGCMLAVTVVAPSIKPSDILSGLGVGSVAIGFAFKDILQNMLAGILILLRQPFEIGDQIISGGHEGTVEKIETRATFIKNYDGVRVVIPNSDIYTNALVVKTAFEKIRSEYDIGIGCNDDWTKAKTLMIESCLACEGVLDDPKPECIPIAIADSSNNIRLRWWTKSDRASVIHTFGRVIEAVYKRLDEEGIDFPYPTQVVLWHDQTEVVDGIRSKQREGWPVGKKEEPAVARAPNVKPSEYPDLGKLSEERTMV